MTDEHQNWTHDNADHDVSVRAIVHADQEQVADVFVLAAMHSLVQDAVGSQTQSCVTCVMHGSSLIQNPKELHYHGVFQLSMPPTNNPWYISILEIPVWVRVCW